MAKLTEQMRTMKQQSKAATQEAVSGHQQFFTTLSGTLAKVTTLGALVTKVYGDWGNRLNEIKMRHDELVPKLGKSLAEYGQQGQAPALKDWLGQLQKSGITREQGLAALEGATKAGELQPTEQREIAGEAAKFGKLGMDTGSLAGMMAEIKKIAPEMTTGDIADTAMGMKNLLGDKAAQAMGADAWQKQLGRLKESGMGSKEALNVAINAMARDEKGMALGLLDKKLSHEKMSTEERKELKRLTDPGDIGAIAEKMEGYRRTDFGAQQLGLALPEQQRAQALALEKDITTQKIGPGQSTLADVQQARLEAASRGGGFSNRMQSGLDGIYRQMDAISRFLGIETAEGQAQSLARAGVRSGQLSQARSDDLLAELKEQTAIMKADSSRDSRRRGVAIDNHTESHGASGGW